MDASSAAAVAASPTAAVAAANPSHLFLPSDMSHTNEETAEEALFVHDSESDDSLLGENNQHTIKASAQALKVFDQFIRRSGVDIDLGLDCSTERLVEALQAFYASGLKKKDGEPYKSNSAFLFRAGLKRHFASRLGVDIVNDPEFRVANDAFVANLREIRMQGKDIINHVPAISNDDLLRLYTHTVFDYRDPKRLQWKVYFDIMLYLYERGDDLRSMDKQTYLLCIDSLGHRYIRYARASVGDQEKRMYELRGDPLCPVMSYERYLTLLHPDCNYFWQRPKKRTGGCDISTITSYDPQPIGLRALKSVMSLISRDACLSRSYSAACILATSPTSLYNQRASIVIPLESCEQIEPAARGIDMRSGTDDSLKREVLCHNLNTAVNVMRLSNGNAKRFRVASGESSLSSLASSTGGRSGCMDPCPVVPGGGAVSGTGIRNVHSESTSEASNDEPVMAVARASVSGPQAAPEVPGLPASPTCLRECLDALVRECKLFCCRHCTIFFGERSDYFLHRGLHGGDMEPWQCSVCRRPCGSKTAFSLHIVNHLHKV